jgi:hypothetical protein
MLLLVLGSLQWPAKQGSLRRSSARMTLCPEPKDAASRCLWHICVSELLRMHHCSAFAS